MMEPDINYRSDWIEMKSKLLIKKKFKIEWKSEREGENTSEIRSRADAIDKIGDFVVQGTRMYNFIALPRTIINSAERYTD